MRAPPPSAPSRWGNHVSPSNPFLLSCAPPRLPRACHGMRGGLQHGKPPGFPEPFPTHMSYRSCERQALGGEPLDTGRVVGGDDERPLRELVEGAVEQRGTIGVERVERLVEQEQLGL